MVWVVAGVALVWAMVGHTFIWFSHLSEEGGLLDEHVKQFINDVRASSLTPLRAVASMHALYTMLCVHGLRFSLFSVSGHRWAYSGWL